MPKANWIQFQPLFQGIIKDYGASSGGKIIDFIVSEIGGRRLSIGKRITPQYRQSESFAALDEFYCALCRTFGSSSGEEIMRRIISEFKGRRVTFISQPDIFLIERNEHIRKLRYNDHLSISIIAERLGVDEATVWRGLREG